MHRVTGWRAALALGMVLSAIAPDGRAQDGDVLRSEAMRRAAVAPRCAALLARHGKAAPVQLYQQGLCLLYGIGRPPMVETGLALLRMAARRGVGEAPLALADTLQAGTPTEQAEALRWYLRAERAGFAEAGWRGIRLQRRLEIRAAHLAYGEIPVAPPGTEIDPTPMALQKLYREGYHCHAMPFGQNWCHAWAD